MLLGSVQKIAQKSLSKKLHLPRVSKTFNSILPSFQFEILATIGNHNWFFTIRNACCVSYQLEIEIETALRA